MSSCFEMTTDNKYNFEFIYEFNCSLVGET